MDLNLVVVCGELVTTPELRAFDSGSRMLRLLIKTAPEGTPQRIDVLPVVLWDPPEDLLTGLPDPGGRVWATGSLQRRFWEGPDGSRSRLEIVAEQVTAPDQEASLA